MLINVPVISSMQGQVAIASHTLPAALGLAARHIRWNTFHNRVHGHGKRGRPSLSHTASEPCKSSEQDDHMQWQALREMLKALGLQLAGLHKSRSSGRSSNNSSSVKDSSSNRSSNNIKDHLSALQVCLCMVCLFVLTVLAV